MNFVEEERRNLHTCYSASLNYTLKRDRIFRKLWTIPSVETIALMLLFIVTDSATIQT